MHINKKILLIILGIAFHSTVMSMKEARITHRKQHTISVTNTCVRDESFNTSLHIARFAYNPEHNPEYMRLLGEWFSTKKSTTTNLEIWKQIVDDMTKPRMFCSNCPCQENQAAEAIRDFVKEVALNLNAGENCAERLVEHGEKVLHQFSLQRTQTGNSTLEESSK